MNDTHDNRREVKESFRWGTQSSYAVLTEISNTSEKNHIADDQGTYLSFGMLMKEAGQVTTVPGEGFGRRLKASGVVPLTSL